MKIFDNKLNKEVSFEEQISINKKIDQLYNFDRNKPFKEDDLSFLTRYVSKLNWKCKYAFWKQKRKNDLYILFIIDHFPERGRRCAMDNSIEVVGSRHISDIEHEELCANIGCCNRVMQTWSYKSVSDLIKEDALYDIATPQKVIDRFKLNGFL